LVVQLKKFLKRLQAANTIRRFAWPLVIAAIILGIIWGQSKVTEEANRPLGPTLPPLPTLTSPTLDPHPQQPAENTPEPTREALCGGPERMLILGAGIDKQSIDQDAAGRVDVIRIIRVDFVKGDVSILTIPRDLWVLIPGLEEQTQPEGYFGYPIVNGEILDEPGDYGRINASYFYGEYYHLPGGGPGILSRTLYDNFGLAIDHYAIVAMETFAEAIDSVGGIDVYLPQDLENFAAGWQHMDGETALRYSRIRKPDTDWARIDRQSQVLLALGKQAVDSKNVASLPAIANSFLGDTVTDLSKAELASLTCLATKISHDTVTTYRIGPEMVTPVTTTRNASVMLPNMERIHVLIAQFLAGEADTSTQAPD
jgi:LCP family protein required for cell wall assembly